MGIGAGSVTNIIDECTKGLEASDLRWIRELAVQLKKEGTTLAEFASIYRRHNYIKKLGTDEDQLESLIHNLLDGAKSVPLEKIADLVNQLFELTKFESIAPAEVPTYVKKKIEEKSRLEDEIQKAGAILRDKNIDIQTIEEYKKLEEELKKHRLSMEDPRRLVSILHSINEIGRDPKKIISELGRIKSLRKEERRLKNHCIIWESRAARNKKMLPLCEELVRFGVGFHELNALHSAIMKMADLENLPFGTAAYALVDGIDMSSKLADMSRHLNEVWKQIQMVNLLSARQNDAINTFMKLRLYGWTEDQILKTCRIIEANGPDNSIGSPPIN
jgi:hypothetical protein